MENASTALLMAGGMLLAILILSLVAYMFAAARDMENAKEQKLVAEQVIAFNAGYEAYNKKLMYGTEIISVVNKAKDYNDRLDGTAQDINIVVKDKDGNVIPISYEHEFKQSVFECTSVEYDNTGRVEEMQFRQKDINNSYMY